MNCTSRKTVGHRFCDNLVQFGPQRTFKPITFCEEPRPAYDRVILAKFFEHRQAENGLALPEWHKENGIGLHVVWAREWSLDETS